MGTMNTNMPLPEILRLTEPTAKQVETFR